MSIRVLIVDDSLFMRAAVRRILEKDGRFEVVGEAKDGGEAVDKVVALRPDVCTMDFNMPVLDGAQAVREIMQRRPTPVVMLSAYTREGARETFEALAAGAVDVVAKPAGEISADVSKIGPQLIERLVGAVGARPMAIAPVPKPTRPTRMSSFRTTIGAGGLPRVAIIAVSTGGPAALSVLLPALPAETSLALVIVQHLPAHFTGPLAERLDQICAIRVREAAAGDVPASGLALIAPGDRHLEFASDGSVRIVDGPEVNGVRPAADVTMRSGAAVYGSRAVGVVMTGMGKDGAAGIKAIKAAGGEVLAQDQSSSVIYGMPRAAVETGCVDRVVPLAMLADALRGH